VLSVADDGIGLPADLDPANAPTLGLKLVGTLARQLDGDLQVERGPGTRFSIRFPDSSP
jgi:two-component sensor histidine kinase